MELRNVEKIDRGGGECGTLKMAGRTEIMGTNIFFTVKKVDNKIK